MLEEKENESLRTLKLLITQIDEKIDQIIIKDLNEAISEQTAERAA